MSLPVYVNEPLTDLQRRAEAFEASELLDQVLPLITLSEQPGVLALAECIHLAYHKPSSVCCSPAAAAMRRVLLPLREDLHC